MRPAAALLFNARATQPSVMHRQEVAIARVEIDAAGRLCVMPAHGSFEFIYRSATEIHWDASRRCLYGPARAELSPGQWFLQVLTAVRSEYGTILVLTAATEWHNVSAATQQEVEHGAAAAKEGSVSTR